MSHGSNSSGDNNSNDDLTDSTAAERRKVEKLKKMKKVALRHGRGWRKAFASAAICGHQSLAKVGLTWVFRTAEDSSPVRRCSWPRRAAEERRGRR
mmetsp:Transcript_61792/g.130445  ORF Transcript_61792/g.130445 Transcript_61792/m.130445 type:complete len:96 (-) Transcript_61792:1354-1641(-)